MSFNFNIKNISKVGFSAFINKISIVFEDIAKFFGEAVWIVLLFSAKTISVLFSKIFKFLWKKTKSVRNFIMNFLKYAGVFVISPFLKIHTAFSKMKSDVSAARNEDGVFGAIKAFLSHFWVFLFGKNGFAVTIFNYAAPVVSIVFLFNVISYSASINYAVRLDVNGQFLGYIESEQVFSDAEIIVEQRLNSLGSFKQIDVSSVFTIEKIGYTETLSPYQVADLILSNSEISVEYAYGIFIDGELIGAVMDNSGVKAALDSVLNKYRTGDPDEEVGFVVDIDCDQTGFYTTDSIIDAASIIESFLRVKEQAAYYTVEDGDSHGLIAEKLEVTQDELERYNEGFKEAVLYTGQKIKYSEEVPQFSVYVTRTEIYETTIPFETEYRNDATMYVDTERTYQEGINGKNTVTARVTRVNGVETERDELSAVNNSLPKTQIILQGTKPSPQNTYSRDNASYGKYIWPVSRNVGYISEYTQWDGGYTGHSGIDIAAPAGTPIYAGASGRVFLSQWYYNYGYTVIIEHSDGLRTLYAHCSKLYVTPGEQVSQGQCIALVGQTGFAQGNHVHFEVRNGNIKLNPINYLD